MAFIFQLLAAVARVFLKEVINSFQLDRATRQSERDKIQKQELKRLQNARKAEVDLLRIDDGHPSGWLRDDGHRRD